MPIRDHTLQHWVNNFYGFGSWKSKIWFVGYEEGGGDLPEEVAEKFDFFYDKHPSANDPILVNIRELAEVVSFYGQRFLDKGQLHGGWKNLIAFVHGYRNKKLPDLLKYQKTSFLSPDVANETLLQLYPLPSPHNHAWYYAWLDMPQHPWLKTRSMYEERFYPARIKTILNNINVYKPEIVLMYQMNNINELKRSIQELHPSAKFKMMKGKKLVTPQHHRADINGTTLILTTQQPTLRHGRAETGFDWYDFGKKVKAND